MNVFCFFKYLNTIKKLIALFFLGMLLHPYNVTATIIVGTYGKTYPILEEDLLSVIYRRIQSLNESQAYLEFNKEIKSHLYSSPSNIFLSRAIKDRYWIFDPSVQIKANIYDTRGQILFPKGFMWNPLQNLTLSKQIIFYDASDPKQMQWVKEREKRIQGKTYWIVVQGKLQESLLNLKQPVYFDQDAKLVKKLNIQHLPAIVWQEGLKLYIREYKL